ncbi:Acyltransferase LovD [Pleurostoma richardsiae]|uniref:Acyltransferase LovD n=1 Tax=Pleurostoma richardsiae TaxID=41990 RepID=A0AA38R5S1_9PEZI|nr:Acyltransferase LovD [Pleurostoma richardsiae]
MSRILPFAAFAGLAAAACISSGPASTVNAALQAGGTGAVVQLCPDAVISITDSSITFTAANQELSTQGYPVDDTRATVIIEPGSNISSAIWGRAMSGVKVLNLQVDGNRHNAGIFGGDALIEVGGGAAGQVVSYNVIKNTRSWSCMHYIGSGQDDNPCREGTVTYNTIGPCGNEGTDAEGNARWADGISFECINSNVSYNNITGSTDGGIVAFGAPGTHFTHNIIESSETDLGFGGLNMVDASYGGNYSGVVVSDNTFVGRGSGLFTLGIGIGSKVWSNPHPGVYFGPAEILNNKFIGNIGFSVVVNGWSEGLTVTGNDISQVTTPSSSFADASSCQAQVQTSFNDNEQLIVYLPSVTGPLDLQSDFTSVPDNATVWMCLSHPLPASLSFAAGALSVDAETSLIASLHGFHAQIQGDGNVVGLDTTGDAWVVKWASSVPSSNCGSDGSLCKISFGTDGDLVETDSNGQLWHSNTTGEGATVIFSNASPYLQVLDASGAELWKIADGVVKT